MAIHDHRISTERLTLRAPEKEDALFILSLVNTEGWLKFIGDRKVHSQTEAENYISKILNSQNIYYWIVLMKASDTPIGIVSFLKRDYLDHYDIGFAFLPQFNGQGFAYESSKAVLHLVRAVFQQKIIAATTIPGNINSVRLLKKLGFSFLKEIHNEGQPLHVYINKEE